MMRYAHALNDYAFRGLARGGFLYLINDIFNRMRNNRFKLDSIEDLLKSGTFRR